MALARRHPHLAPHPPHRADHGARRHRLGRRRGRLGGRLLSRPPALRLGLDIGSTLTKAVVIDEDGHTVATASAPTPFNHHNEMPVDELLATVRTVLHELGPSHPPAAIGIAGMAECGAPLDRTERPLAPVIAWHDPRGQAQVDRLQRAFDDEPELPLRLGQRLRSVMTVAKLAWLLEDGQPGPLPRPARWLGVPELVLHALTGAHATEHSLAARTGCYDVIANHWLPDVANAAGFDISLFPPVRRAGTPMGRVTAQAAATFRLPTGIPVTLAGHDHLAGLRGAGITAVQVGNSVGTAETLVARTSRPPDVRRALDHHVAVSVAPGGNQWALFAGAARSGIILTRAAAALRSSPADLDAQAQAAATASATDAVPMDHLLDALARDAEPPPLPDADPGAVWAGLLDALAARTAAAYDRLAAITTTTTTATTSTTSQVVVFGGGSRSDPWLAAKQRHLAVPVTRSPHADAPARGAALTAPVP